MINNIKYINILNLILDILLLLLRSVNLLEFI